MKISQRLKCWFICHPNTSQDPAKVNKRAFPKQKTTINHRTMQFVCQRTKSQCTHLGLSLGRLLWVLIYPLQYVGVVLLGNHKDFPIRLINFLQLLSGSLSDSAPRVSRSGSATPFVVRLCVSGTTPLLSSATGRGNSSNRRALLNNNNKFNSLVFCRFFFVVVVVLFGWS